MKKLGCCKTLFCTLYVAFFLSGCAIYEKPQAVTSKEQREITGKDGKIMVLIPAGEFTMGSPEGKGYYNEHPSHKVYLDAYYIDKYEVTVAQYRKFCEATGRSMPKMPRWGWIDNHPIVKVTWHDATAYAEYYGKRLPTEAEWEKACRSGSNTRYCYGDAESELGKYAWYGEKGTTSSVGQKEPNAWGLYDMHGNVWEWCADRHETDYYKDSPYKNPQGPSSGRERVLRGGGWGNMPGSCRSASRNGVYSTTRGNRIGFRCAASATQ